MGGFDYLLAAYKKQIFPRHAHDEYLIGLIQSGTHDVWCRGELWHADTGAIATFAPGEPHEELIADHREARHSASCDRIPTRTRTSPAVARSRNSLGKHASEAPLIPLFGFDVMNRSSARPRPPYPSAQVNERYR